MSIPGIQKEKEPFHKYVELEVKKEPVVKESTTPDPPSRVLEEMLVNKQLAIDTTIPNLTPYKSGLQRSTHSRQQPNWYSPSLRLLLTEQEDPSSVAEASQVRTKSNGNRP